MYTDVVLKGIIDDLAGAVEQWAKQNDIWDDCGFKSWLEHYDDEPKRQGPVLVMWFEGTLHGILNYEHSDDLHSEFDRLIADKGFFFELQDGVTGCFHLLDEESELQAAFDDYFHWQWICSLVQPDSAEIYDEIYSHFANRPDDLRRLGHRQFEVLIERAFSSRGYRTELGPGSNDGGVDVRIWTRDPIGDVLTLVQAKRYQNTPISLEAVSALSGHVDDQKANRGLFVTTSRYLPSVRKFASRQAGRIVLADSSDVAKWCAEASAFVIADRSKLVSEDHVRKLVEDIRANSVDDRLLCGGAGYSMVINRFAIVLKETNRAALLMTIPAVAIAGDGQVGHEIPLIDETTAAWCRDLHVFRAKRSQDGNRTNYWGGGVLYTKWNGAPVYFSYLD